LEVKMEAISSGPASGPRDGLASWSIPREAG